ncbi:Uncharacterised protein [uncultured archaeon]|nr:Uncharacterised protein [uncultured archaeon]
MLKITPYLGIMVVIASICILTTSAAPFLGLAIAPRAWCCFCPMQLPANEILEKPDCIKCARCVEACPKEALRF